MTTQHTPGPWHVVLNDNATPFIQHEQGEDFSDVNDRSSRVCVMPAELLHGYNSHANARLIASAPDLLDALQALLDAHAIPSSVCNERPAYDKALAAIAKATGRQP